MEDFLFDLENPIENLDNVPAEFKPLYVQGSDGFKPDPAKATPEIIKSALTSYNAVKTNLKTSNAAKTAANAQAAQERTNAAKYAAVAKQFNADSPEKLTVVLTGLTDKVKTGENIDIEQVKKDITEGKNAEIAAEKAKREKAERFLEKTLVDNVVGAAIEKAQGSKALLTPVIRQSVKMVETEDGGYAARVINPDTGAIRSDANGSPLEINALVESLKSNADFGQAFKAVKPGGGRTEDRQAVGTRQDTNVRKVGDNREQTRSSVEKIKAGLEKRGFGNP